MGSLGNSILKSLKKPYFSYYLIRPVFSPLRQFYHPFRLCKVITPSRHLHIPLPTKWQNYRLANLETQANDDHQSATKQHKYYKELLKCGHNDVVISRFESGLYAANEGCVKSYLVALARYGENFDSVIPLLSKALPKTPSNLQKFNDKAVKSNPILSNLFGPNADNDKTSNSQEPVFQTTLPFQQGGKENPLYVVVQEGKRYILLKALKPILQTFITAFIILTSLSLLLESQGVFKATRPKSEVEHVTKNEVHFSDVQGCDEAKQELEEIVEFLKNPSKFTDLGGRLPKGVLLTGPPGTGKTLLARAVAGEAGVPFFFMSGSEFDEMFVGVGAQRVRKLFAAARLKAPSIVFIDELDAIGSKRNPRDEKFSKQTLNQLLVDLDGFSPSEGVVFIAATNYPESLDKALIRPGRFDRHVHVPLPDVRGRIEIMKLHLGKLPKDGVSKDVDISVIARGCPGFSGADLANLVNHAAIRASRMGAKEISMKELEWAKDKIVMGAERRSAVITDENKRLTAFHEGGHALVAMYTQGAMPLHKATIIPRGMSLGMTVQLPELDKHSYTKREYLAQLDVCMGGRAAEELVFGEEDVTSGSHNDLMKATEIARKMVMAFGMGEQVGKMYYSEEDLEKLSFQTRQDIEKDVNGLLESSYSRALSLLHSKRKELELLATALTEYETLDQKDIERVVCGETPHIAFSGK